MAPADTAPRQRILLRDPGASWHESWRRRDFTIRHRNRYRRRAEGSHSVLEIRSAESAGGVYHSFRHEPVPAGTLSWRWKVSGAIPGDPDERTENGDDFAARVFVVFETHTLPWRHKAICYVWSANQPPGTVFASPRSDDVGTIVLRRGSAEAGAWRRERRDVKADYRAYFGRDPRRISAVALMVDTDDTNTTATAWFDDMVYDFAEETP